jgi:HAMP domain-containing protein
LGLDYLFFSDSPWSIVNQLSKIVSILIKIFAPLFSPVLYYWIGEVIIPIAMILCAIILLYISVASAKVAMSKATPDVNDEILVPQSSYPEAPSHMEAVDPMAYDGERKPRRYGFAWKLTIYFGTVALLFGVTVSLILYSLLVGAVEKGMKLRARDFVSNLSELAARPLNIRDKALGDAMSRFSKMESVAYVYVEDGEGKIIANVPKDLALFLHRDFPKSAERALEGVDVEYRGKPVYEIATGLRGDRSGYVHLAIWRNAVELETRGAVTPVAILVLVLLTIATGIIGWFIWRHTAPFVKLVDSADRVSRGELDLPMAIDQPDEIGDLSRSFERMRSSLHAGVKRLEEDKVPEQLSG